MAAPIPIPDGCCAQQCKDQVIVQVPGPSGSPGAPGTNGSNGVDAFTTTAANFVVPAVSGTVSVQVADSSWAANGQPVFVTSAGTFRVSGIPDSTHLTLFNLGYSENAVPTTVIAFPQQVAPAGFKGLTGTTPSVTLNSLSPTTTKGDILADTGANSPSAGLTRLGVGANGKSLVADSSQGTGLNYATITPNSVALDNAIPRYNGTSGTPMPLQDSKMVITDDGALQSSGTLGNARGTAAVDLQVSRADPAQVASGNQSVIAGGENNTASGLASVVGGGVSNVASGGAAAVAGGSVNVASGNNSFIGGGTNNEANASNSAINAGTGNVASATNATVAGGSNNTASAVNSTVAGGQNNTAGGQSSSVIGGIQSQTTLDGQITHACGSFASPGDAQASRLVSRNNTTDATPTSLFCNGSSSRMVVPNNTAWAGKGYVLGRTSAGVCAYYPIEFGIKNNAGTVTLIGSATVGSAVADGGWAAGGVAVTADAINVSLDIAVTGVVATNLRWVAVIDFVEVSY